MIVRQMLVKLRVIALRHLRSRAHPERLHRIEDLIFNNDGLLSAGFRLSGLVFFNFLANVLKNDRVGYKVGIPLDDAGQNPFIRVILDAVFGISRLEM